MSEPFPQRLGDFEIVRELGRGGMGVVYEARQVSLNRRVALQVLGPGLGLTPKAIDRFRREAEAAARLHHTNIVPVYATGECHGTHFYAMELVDGPSLDQVIRRLRGGPGGDTRTEPSAGAAVTGPYVPAVATPPPSETGSGPPAHSSADRFDRAAAMIADVADALHHAHQQGVTHRDVKPSNLLLSSDGRLSVTDFGLARMLEQPGMTVTGEFVGTPAYMSPEQVTAGRVPVDHRTDVYSLGATLYELLTLRPPFAADGRDRLLALVVQKEPAPPRSVDPKVPRDLETVCLKCLQKDPDQRYQTAKELADDLRRYLNRFAIRARRAGPLARAKKWVKRNPALAAVAAAALLALAAAGLFARRAHEAERQRRADEQRRDQELTSERRRAAVEREMTAALAADLPAAEKAVADAEALGASAGETRLLRGFIALHNGRTTEAVGHLEQAVRLMPDGVAPRALLAKAHGEALNGPAARRVLDEALLMSPRTPEDKLFLGQAINVFRPADGLALMDQALAERPSGIGHLLRAAARVGVALETEEVTDADAALADTEVAKRLLPGNSFPLASATYARLAAAIAYRRAGQREKADECMAAAGREAEALARFRGNYECVCARYMASLVRDGLDVQTDMTAELREARAATPSPGLAFLEALNLFCLGRDAEAGAVADGIPDPRSSGYVRFLAALGRPDGRADARRAWERYGGPGRPPGDRLEAAPLLFAAGGAEEVAAVARELRASGDRFQYIAPRLTYSPAELAVTLAFLEGTASEADLLDRPASGAVEQCRRHSLVGWKRLGAGDREGAKAAFRQAYEATPFGVMCWGGGGARAVLIRMRDPDWPQAVPKK
jgi:tetratricopeptide (TPR) repeat protein